MTNNEKILDTNKTSSALPNPPEGMPRIMPHLFYDDVAAAVDWLVEAFGFVVRNSQSDEDGRMVHGDLKVADAIVMIGLTEENEHWESPQAFPGKVCQRLFIYVDDIDAHFKQAVAAGAKVWSEPKDQWYGERVYEVIDPEGHRWKFAQAIFKVDQEALERPS